MLSDKCKPKQNCEALREAEYTIMGLEAELRRALFLAIKHCAHDHPDMGELLRMVKDETE